ncbi:hypothetical protein KI387_036819, partial [Taxus chinensis]
MNLAITEPGMVVRGIAYTQLVKYYVAMIMNSWPSVDEGENFHIKPRPHVEKGHGVAIGYKKIS